MITVASEKQKIFMVVCFCACTCACACACACISAHMRCGMYEPDLDINIIIASPPSPTQYPRKLLQSPESEMEDLTEEIAATILTLPSYPGDCCSSHLIESQHYTAALSQSLMILRRDRKQFTPRGMTQLL